MAICWMKSLESARFLYFWMVFNGLKNMAYKKKYQCKERYVYFSGGKIWLPIPVYHYENPCGYVTRIQLWVQIQLWPPFYNYF